MLIGHVKPYFRDYLDKQFIGKLKLSFVRYYYPLKKLDTVKDIDYNRNLTNENILTLYKNAIESTEHLINAVSAQGQVIPIHLSLLLDVIYKEFVIFIQQNYPATYAQLNEYVFNGPLEDGQTLGGAPKRMLEELDLITPVLYKGKPCFAAKLKALKFINAEKIYLQTLQTARDQNHE